jgi:ketosteroid isomerase-like protein
VSAADVDLVRHLYAAFSAGDIEALAKAFAEDVTWSVPGNSAISGIHQGRDAVFAHFGDLATRTQGTAVVTLMDVAGGTDRVYATDRLTATATEPIWTTPLCTCSTSRTARFVPSSSTSTIPRRTKPSGHRASTFVAGGASACRDTRVGAARVAQCVRSAPHQRVPCLTSIILH